MVNFKGKVGVTTTILSIVMVVVLYLLVMLPWSKQVQEGAKADVQRGTALVQHLLNLRAHEMVVVASEAANGGDFVAAIQQVEAAARREGVFKAIGNFDAKLRAKLERKADFFGVVDAEGKIVARDLNIHDMYGEKLPYVSIKHALSGRATSDVWFMKNRLMRAAAAPIRVDGIVKGAVVIAFDFTDAQGKEESDQFDSHVVYFLDGAVRASSFPKDGACVKAINSTMLGANGKAVMAAITSKKSGIFTVELNGSTYLAAAGSLPPPVTIHGGKPNGEPAKVTSAAVEQKAGYLVLVNRTSRFERITTTRYALLGFLIILVLFALAIAWAVAKHFVDAEDQLELGVAEVINGDVEYVFDSTDEFEGLANALNVMLARLLGRPEPGDEEDEASWRADVINIDELTDPSEGDRALANEAEDVYLSRLHGEYIAARKTAALSLEGITLASFSQKVKANEAMLKAKHKCEMVRFAVNSSGGKVSLRPVRLG
ncbi:MAG: cache domain-containing protein [Deltaproteobacteria bacterium]|nr:cache domain-containing protein [Deltaproteobacteria bacterium]